MNYFVTEGCLYFTRSPLAFSLIVAQSLAALILVFLAMPTGAQTPQWPTYCTAYGGNALCIPASVTYGETFNVQLVFQTGDEACIAAAGSQYGTWYRNAKFYVNFPSYGTGCQYDLYTDGTNYQGRFFYQGWAAANQNCPTPPTLTYNYTDASDQSVALSGRKWCGYAVQLFVAAPAPPTAQCGPCIADPINPANGAVFRSDTVAASLSALSVFKQFYNSANLSNGDLGTSWRHAFSRSITRKYSNVIYHPYIQGSPDNSSLYNDVASACNNGFAEIKSRVSRWINAIASYTNSVCTLSVGSTIIGTLPIFYLIPQSLSLSQQTPGIPPGALPIGFDAIRDDSQLVSFVVNGSSIVAPRSIALRLQQTTGGFQLIDENDSIETYDANGVLQSITSRAGVTQTMTYDASGRLSTVTDSFGHRLTFSYDTQNRLQSVTRQ